MSTYGGKGYGLKCSRDNNSVLINLFRIPTSSDTKSKT